MNLDNMGVLILILALSSGYGNLKIEFRLVDFVFQQKNITVFSGGKHIISNATIAFLRFLEVQYD